MGNDLLKFKTRYIITPLPMKGNTCFVNVLNNGEFDEICKNREFTGGNGCDKMSMEYFELRRL
jgi:hypothetical protein